MVDDAEVDFIIANVATRIDEANNQLAVNTRSMAELTLVKQGAQDMHQRLRDLQGAAQLADRARDARDVSWERTREAHAQRLVHERAQLENDRRQARQEELRGGAAQMEVRADARLVQEARILTDLQSALDTVGETRRHELRAQAVAPAVDVQALSILAVQSLKERDDPPPPPRAPGALPRSVPRAGQPGDATKRKCANQL